MDSSIQFTDEIGLHPYLLVELEWRVALPQTMDGQLVSSRHSENCPRDRLSHGQDTWCYVVDEEEER